MGKDLHIAWVLTLSVLQRWAVQEPRYVERATEDSTFLFVPSKHIWLNKLTLNISDYEEKLSLTCVSRHYDGRLCK